MTTPDTDIEPRYDTNGDPAEPDTLANLPVDHLHPADDNPRQHLGDLTELAATITAHGIIEPLVVHPRNIGGGWTIVAGHRRHAESLSRHHKGLGIRARDARALRRVAELVRRHDTVCRLDVA